MSIQPINKVKVIEKDPEFASHVGDHMGVMSLAFDAPANQTTIFQASCPIDVAVYSAALNTQQLNNRDRITLDFMPRTILGVVDTPAAADIREIIAPQTFIDAIKSKIAGMGVTITFINPFTGDIYEQGMMDSFDLETRRVTYCIPNPVVIEAGWLMSISYPATPPLASPTEHRGWIEIEKNFGQLNFGAGMIGAGLWPANSPIEFRYENKDPETDVRVVVYFEVRY